MKIRGLTLIRPWGYAIAHCGKNIENRSWNCYLKPGDYIAIHNGKKWDKSAIECIADCMDVQINITKEQDKDSQIIAVAKFGGNYQHHDSKWFVGDVGWLLEDVTPIEPAPCGGRQGLWKLPNDVLVQVRANYVAAKAKEAKLLGGAA